MLATTNFNNKLPDDTTHEEQSAEAKRQEYINENYIKNLRYAYSEYYTGAQVALYISNVMVDEMVSIGINVVQNLVPRYHYTDKWPRRILHGQGIVQGELAINYKHPAYLQLYLKNSDENTDVSSEDFNSAAYDKTVVDFSRAVNEAAYDKENPDYEEMFSNLSSAPSLYTSLDSNDFSLDSYGYCDLKLLFGGERAITRVIKGVKFAGPRISITYEGQPILEVYQFLARGFN